MINSCADLLVLLRSMEEPGKEQRKKNVKLLEKQVKQRPETTEWLVQILEDESKWTDNQYCGMYERIFVQLVESPHLDLALAKRIFRFIGLYQNENNRMNRDTSRRLFELTAWIERSEFFAELEPTIPDIQKEVKERNRVEDEKTRLDNEKQEMRYQNRLREEIDNEDSKKTVRNNKKKPKGRNNKSVVDLDKQHTNNQNGSQNQNGSSSTITPKTSPLCSNRHCESIRGINDVLETKIAEIESRMREMNKEMREMKKDREEDRKAMQAMESRICNLERQAGPTLARNLIDALKEDARKLDEKEKNDRQKEKEKLKLSPEQEEEYDKRKMEEPMPGAVLLDQFGGEERLNLMKKCMSRKVHRQLPSPGQRLELPAVVHLPKTEQYEATDFKLIDCKCELEKIFARHDTRLTVHFLE